MRTNWKRHWLPRLLIQKQVRWGWLPERLIVAKWQQHAFRMATRLGQPPVFLARRPPGYLPVVGLPATMAAEPMAERCGTEPDSVPEPHALGL